MKTRKKKSNSDSLSSSFASTSKSLENTASVVEIQKAKFDPNVAELKVGWGSAARSIYCVNSYPNGITMSVHDNGLDKKTRSSISEDEAELSFKFHPDQFHLRFRDTKDYRIPQGKYFLYKENCLDAFEKHLSAMHKDGSLKHSVFYFGTISDPFTGLHKKFDYTIGCLQLLEQYRPASVVVQSRSPMAISALPLLKLFGDSAVLAIPVETRLEKSIKRYTPGQPRISERLITADGFRAQGITVNLVASPILPYGELYRDAWEFAEMLDSHADYISLGSLASGQQADESQLKTLPVSQRLVADNELRLLRPHCYRYLYYALKSIAPEKLLIPFKSTKPSQLSLFAA